MNKSIVVNIYPYGQVTLIVDDIILTSGIQGGCIWPQTYDGYSALHTPCIHVIEWGNPEH